MPNHGQIAAEIVLYQPSQSHNQAPRNEYGVLLSRSHYMDKATGSQSSSFAAFRTILHACLHRLLCTIDQDS